jgi:TPP-dependent pyruvate/acetoin dehydrogenase alpha subunit
VEKGSLILAVLAQHYNYDIVDDRSTWMNRSTIYSSNEFDRISLDGIAPRIALSLYRFMVRLRLSQEILRDTYHPADEIRCPVHFCIGQEAAPAALSQVLRSDDHLYCHHRSHGYYYAKGGGMNPLFAELYGKSTGCNGGLAGSQEISDHSINFYSGAILSGMMAIAVGAGLAFRLKKIDRIACGVFGDGASDEGIFWEAVNLASLKRLPVIFLCENNGFSTYSPQCKRQPFDNISERVASFGITCKTLFGNDVAQLYRVLLDAADSIRRGNGPIFIESYTWRWNAHVGPEDDDYIGYRPASESEFWKAHCPLKLLETAMMQIKILTASGQREIADAARAEIDAAFAYAKKSPFPAAPDWASLNTNAQSPQADRLLTEAESNTFDFRQHETMPEPY